MSAVVAAGAGELGGSQSTAFIEFASDLADDSHGHG